MNSYEEFLQAIDELYDQNKIDFNNYKLLKKELESIEKIHEQQKSEYRNYFKMLESKINNIVVSGGGLTENQVENIVSNYVATHKSELTGARGERGEKGDKGNKGEKGDKGEQGIQGIQGLQGEKGEKGDKGDKGEQGIQGIQGVKGVDGLTTQIRVNGSIYTQSNGLITLPDYPTSGGSGSGSPTITISFNGNTYTPDSNGVITLPNIETSGGSGTTGSIDTSNFINFNNTYVTDCNLHYINGYAKTNPSTLHLPTACAGHNTNAWGIIFCLLENSVNATGTQMFFPIDGVYKGRIFVRSVKDLKTSHSITSSWVLLALDTSYNGDVPNPENPGEIN